MYNAVVSHYFAQDDHIGYLDPHSAAVGTGVAGVAGRGDVIQLQIAVAGEVVQTVKGLVYGSPASMAALAWLAETLPGSTVQQLGEITGQNIYTALGLPPIRLAAAVLAADALRLASSDYQRKQSSM
jgi:NifU-like protein involved in Fe-S cluster formation